MNFLVRSEQRWLWPHDFVWMALNNVGYVPQVFLDGFYVGVSNLELIEVYFFDDDSALAALFNEPHF